jgi:hypothetical protein
MNPHEQIAAVYAKLHQDRELHIEQARRARDMQAMLEMSQRNVYKSQEIICDQAKLLVKLYAGAK